MKKTSMYVMGLFVAMTLTQCKEGDTGNLFNALVLPRVIITFDNPSYSELTLNDFVLTDDANEKEQTWIDCNANLVKDEGEELVKGKTYRIEKETIHIFGYTKKLDFEATAPAIASISISNRYLEEMTSATESKIQNFSIANAQALKKLSCKFSKLSQLSVNEIGKIEFISLEGTINSSTEDMQRFFDSLPTRTTEGIIRIKGDYISKEQENKLKAKKWTVIRL